MGERTWGFNEKVVADRARGASLMRLIITLLVNAVALLIAVWLFDGITLTGDSDTERAVTLLVVAAIFALVNAIVRPIVQILSIPLYILTLGLIHFVINALMLMLTSWISDQFDLGFHVDGFWTALGGALVVSIVATILGAILRDSDA
jgi:putative membrane protein